MQRRAYAVEAELIGYDDIPPLHETLEALQDSGETFFGAYADDRLIGAISWRYADATIDIHRLVVDPDAFRRGTGSALLRAALDAEQGAERAVVQTGADNQPANALYLREGFARLDERVVAGLRVARFGKRLG